MPQMKGEATPPGAKKFRLGVNYWPVKKAMYWWQAFDLDEVCTDFQKIREYGLEVVRIFLLWEDFQPAPNRVAAGTLGNLVAVAEAAAGCGLRLLPTLFCGHMSGANWLPGWILEGPATPGRFPVICGGKAGSYRIRNCYTDGEVIRAQQFLCREVAGTLQGHPAVWAYDLGNESSNWVIPPDRQRARDWLETMAGELKERDPGRPVTLGMHAEDLEEDRRLWPQDAARYCDFLCMHGYPFYLSWVEDPLEVQVLPFLGAITRWLGGKPVLFEEFGLYGQLAAKKTASGNPAETGLRYYQEALQLLYAAGMTGALAWCYGDYHPSLWERPPLRENPHERYFGLFSYDLSPKPAARAFQEFASRSLGELLCREAPLVSWLDAADRERFYDNPRLELQRLYRKFMADPQAAPGGAAGH